MRTRAFTAFTLILTAALTHAAEQETLSTTPASSAANNSTPTFASSSGFQLKNRSTFTASSDDKDSRDPFWPIGWVKTAANSTAVAAPVTLTLKAENFEVSAILLNNPPLAVINGKEMAEGQIAQVRIDNQIIPVQLAAVQDGRIVLRYRDQDLIIPLHRKGEAQPHGNASSPLGTKTALR